MSEDGNYPDIDISFLHELLSSCEKCIDSITSGATTSYILEGTSFIGKRTIILRNTESGVVPFEKATSIAIKTKTFDALLAHMEKNHKFKDGGYTS